MSDRLGPPPPTLEPGLEARRAKWRESKRKDRDRELERASVIPTASTFTMPKMPGALPLIRKWLQGAHDAYSHKKISSAELMECRRSALAVGDLYKAGAELRKAEAAIRAAEAQERMAEALAKYEHGGAAVMLLQRLQASITDGPRRPLPGRPGKELAEGA